MNPNDDMQAAFQRLYEALNLLHSAPLAEDVDKTGTAKVWTEVFTLFGRATTSWNQLYQAYFGKASGEDLARVQKMVEQRSQASMTRTLNDMIEDQARQMDAYLRNVGRTNVFTPGKGDLIVISNVGNNVTMQETDLAQKFFEEVGIKVLIFAGPADFTQFNASQLQAMAKELMEDGPTRSGSSGRPVREPRHAVPTVRQGSEAGEPPEGWWGNDLSDDGSSGHRSDSGSDS